MTGTRQHDLRARLLPGTTAVARNYRRKKETCLPATENHMSTRTFLTRHQAAEYIGCSLRTIDNLTRRGVLTRYKDRRDGRLTLIDPDELNNLDQPQPIIPAA